MYHGIAKQTNATCMLLVYFRGFINISENIDTRIKKQVELCEINLSFYILITNIYAAQQCVWNYEEINVHVQKKYIFKQKIKKIVIMYTRWSHKF